MTQNIYLSLKQKKLKLQFISKRDYTSIKLRTFLNELGYKRRNDTLIEKIKIASKDLEEVKMSAVIRNPREDQYGNQKENIFLAFDSEENYLGSAYTFPTINRHQTNEIPYLIFIAVNMEEAIDAEVKKQAKQKLFDNVLSRAKELRSLEPDLKARIYAGFEYSEETLGFYIENGFEEDYSIIMETDIPEEFSYTFADNVEILEYHRDSEQDMTQYKALYDELFVTPLDLETLEEQEKNQHFKNIAFIIDGEIQGGCTIYEKNNMGYIETLYVLPKARGKGLSKLILSYIFNYFSSIGLNKSRLEVWRINKRAVNLYKSFGYREVKKNLMFPGITI